MRLLAFTLLSLVPALLPALAGAQVAGVPVDTLTPPGMQRVDVSLPFHAGVQLFFAPDGQSRASVRVDLELASDTADAADAAEWFERTTVGALPTVPGIGDQAHGSHDLVAFVRDNVFVVVRSLDGSADAIVLARQMDIAIQHAPRGAPVSDVRVSVPPLSVGVNPLQLPAQVLAAHVEANGSASARRTRAGWVVALSGHGPHSLTVLTCDRLLRRRVTMIER